MQSFHDYWKDSFGELPITFVGKSLSIKARPNSKKKNLMMTLFQRKDLP